MAKSKLDSITRKVLAATVGSGTQTRSPSNTTPGRTYVRSLSQIAEYFPPATGRRLTEAEVVDAYGPEVIKEVESEGFALLCESPKAAGRLISLRRELLRLDHRHVANMAGVTEDQLRKLEDGYRVPIRQAESVARALGLDERMLSWKAEASPESERVAVRLRTIGDEKPLLTSHAVSAIAEATWVATTQIRLQEKLDFRPERFGIRTSRIMGAPAQHLSLVDTT